MGYAQIKKLRQTNKAYYYRGLVYSRAKYKEARLAILCLLGNKCVRCGFADIRALQIDHIRGDGKYDRQTLGSRATTVVYRYYLANPKEALERLQILCANCNWIKRVENKELPIRFKEC